MSKYFNPFTIMLTHEEQYVLEKLSELRHVDKDSLIAHLILTEYRKEVNKNGNIEQRFT